MSVQDQIRLALRSEIEALQEKRRIDDENFHLRPQAARQLEEELTSWVSEFNNMRILNPSRFIDPKLSIATEFNSSSGIHPEIRKINICFGRIIPEALAGAEISNNNIYAGEIVPSGTYDHRIKGQLFTLSDAGSAVDLVKRSAVQWLLQNKKIKPEVVRELTQFQPV